MAIASKGRGKSGGARVITYNVQQTEKDVTITLMSIYDLCLLCGFYMSIIILHAFRVARICTLTMSSLTSCVIRDKCNGFATTFNHLYL